MDKNILQIMPAEGWNAVYEENGRENERFLTGWALVQNGDYQRVTGLVNDGPKVVLADSLPGLKRYRHNRQV